MERARPLGRCTTGSKSLNAPCTCTCISKTTCSFHGHCIDRPPSRRDRTTMLPREHGAYGQLLFPLGAALAIAGVHPSGMLTATAAVAAFVAHEPLVLLLGGRGARARREQRRQAIMWLAISGAVAVAAGF